MAIFFDLINVLASQLNKILSNSSVLDLGVVMANYFMDL